MVIIIVYCLLMVVIVDRVLVMEYGCIIEDDIFVVFIGGIGKFV